MKRSPLRFIPALLSGVIVLAGCDSMHVRTLEQSSDIQQLTDDEARRWYAAKELDRIWQHQGLIYADDELTAYLQSVAVKLYPEFSETVRMRVIDSPDLNAFALPNGSVYLNFGMIARMENEAQLATVIAHEVSHFKFQHSLKQRHAMETAVIAGWTVRYAGLALVGALVLRETLGATKLAAVACIGVGVVALALTVALLMAPRPPVDALETALAAVGLARAADAESIAPAQFAATPKPSLRR